MCDGCCFLGGYVYEFVRRRHRGRFRRQDRVHEGGESLGLFACFLGWWGSGGSIDGYIFFGIVYGHRCWRGVDAFLFDFIGQDGERMGDESGNVCGVYFFAENVGESGGDRIVAYHTVVFPFFIVDGVAFFTVDAIVFVVFATEECSLDGFAVTSFADVYADFFLFKVLSQGTALAISVVE